MDDVAKMWWEDETDISRILSKVEIDAIEKKKTVFYSFPQIFQTYAPKRHILLVTLCHNNSHEQKGHKKMAPRYLCNIKETISQSMEI